MLNKKKNFVLGLKTRSKISACICDALKVLAEDDNVSSETFDKAQHEMDMIDYYVRQLFEGLCEYNEDDT